MYLPMPYIDPYRQPIINSPFKDLPMYAEHRPVSVESEGHRGMNGGQQTPAGHRSIFNQTLTHIWPVYDEQCSPMYEQLAYIGRAL
jgi:hypothetical protein